MMLFAMDDMQATPTLEVLLTRVGVLELEDTRLRAEVEQLVLELATARKDSRNSSTPPSSDLVKPPPPGRKSKRRIGGQPGHAPHFRQSFSFGQLDEGRFSTRRPRPVPTAAN